MLFDIQFIINHFHEEPLSEKAHQVVSRLISIYSILTENPKHIRWTMMMIHLV